MTTLYSIIKPEAFSKDVFEHFDKNKPFVVCSVPGIGRSSLLSNLAIVADYHLIDFRTSQMSKSDFQCIPNIAGLNSEPAFVKEVLEMRQLGKKIAFMFDDVNCAAQEVVEIFEKSVIDRTIGPVSLAENDIVFATSHLGDNNIPQFGFLSADTLSKVSTMFLTV